MTKTSLLVALALLLPGIPALGAVAQSAQLAAPQTRVLPLQGGQNFRDLGGYRTSDGRMVKWRLLYRSGSMHFLTAADQAYLERLGIRTVCDFRDVRERATEPAAWPQGPATRVLADDYSMDLGGIGKTAPGHVATAKEAQTKLTALYPKMLMQFNGQYRRMFAELLAGHAPLAFNCTAGKDRTGIAAALLLTALGVPRTTVVEDYALTNRYFDPSKVVHGDNTAYRQWQSLPPATLRAYMAADPAYIGAVFKVMDAHRGGVAGYLADELGLTSDKVARLRELYTS